MEIVQRSQVLIDVEDRCRIHGNEYREGELTAIDTKLSSARFRVFQRSIKDGNL